MVPVNGFLLWRQIARGSLIRKWNFIPQGPRVTQSKALPVATHHNKIIKTEELDELEAGAR
jgi:hypothetical protein